MQRIFFSNFFAAFFWRYEKVALLLRCTNTLLHQTGYLSMERNMLI
jgi:hypothetical protein